MELENREMMDLCGSCDKFVRTITCDFRDLKWTVKLLLSAKTCRLCDFLASCLTNDISDRNVSKWGRTRDVRVASQEYDINCRAFQHPSGALLDISFKGSQSYVWFNLALWADEGSAAANCANFKTTAPLADCHSANQRIKAWLDNCLESHKECLSLMSGGIVDESCKPKLPKRVIDVGNSSAPTSVRLVETAGSHGHYVALSHCWGPPDKRPLRTTTATLEKHLKGIRFEELPKTFQDAVVVTRAVGMQYLWIDSLCILQDNEDEWRAEAGKMGSLYERATLTIAASGAHDSTEGCYLAKSWNLPSIRVPYYIAPEDDVASGRSKKGSSLVGWYIIRGATRLIDSQQIGIDICGTMEISEANIEKIIISGVRKNGHCYYHLDFIRLSLFLGHHRVETQHYIHEANAEGGNVIGVAAMDGKVGSNIFSLAVMRSKIPVGLAGPSHSSAESSELKKTNCSYNKEKRSFHPASAHGDWILILEELPQSSPDIRDFKKVGIGLVWADLAVNKKGHPIRIR